MFIDISMHINNKMQVFPGDPKVAISDYLSMQKGDTCNVKNLVFGSHTGTHIDAPRHFLPNGAAVPDVAGHIGEHDAYLRAP